MVNVGVRFYVYANALQRKRDREMKINCGGYWKIDRDGTNGHLCAPIYTPGGGQRRLIGMSVVGLGMKFDFKD